MTDEIKKMLEQEQPLVFNWVLDAHIKDGTVACNFKTQDDIIKLVQDLERFKRGFECLVKQRDVLLRVLYDSSSTYKDSITLESWFKLKNFELEAAMKGEET
jgi:hypothetical protein